MQPLNPHGSHAPLALLQGKAHALSLVQLAQAGMLYRADMDENIVPAGIRRYKTIALSGVEPFDNSREGGLLAYIVILHRFHIDTFLTPELNRAWVIMPVTSAGIVRLRALIRNYQMEHVLQRSTCFNTRTKNRTVRGDTLDAMQPRTIRLSKAQTFPRLGAGEQNQAASSRRSRTRT
jgi:hypothetical protein